MKIRKNVQLDLRDQTLQDIDRLRALGAHAKSWSIVTPDHSAFIHTPTRRAGESTMSTTPNIFLRYRLSEKARRSYFENTGTMPDGTQTLEVSGASLSHEARVAVATLRDKSHLVEPFDYTDGSDRFDGVSFATGPIALQVASAYHFHVMFTSDSAGILLLCREIVKLTTDATNAAWLAWTEECARARRELEQLLAMDDDRFLDTHRYTSVSQPKVPSEHTSLMRFFDADRFEFLKAEHATLQDQLAEKKQRARTLERARDEAAEAARAQERAAKRAEQERKEQEFHDEMLRWLQENHQPRLLGLAKRGYEVRAMYLEARLAVEHPGWIHGFEPDLTNSDLDDEFYDPEDPDTRLPSSAFLAAQDLHPDAEPVWVCSLPNQWRARMEKDGRRHRISAWPGCEALRVLDYLGFAPIYLPVYDEEGNEEHAKVRAYLETNGLIEPATQPWHTFSPSNTQCAD